MQAQTTGKNEKSKIGSKEKWQKMNLL